MPIMYYIELKQVWISLDQFGQVKTNLDRFKQVGTHFNQFGHVQSNLEKFQAIWKKHVQLTIVKNARTKKSLTNISNNSLFNTREKLGSVFHHRLESRGFGYV